MEYTFIFYDIFEGLCSFLLNLAPNILIVIYSVVILYIYQSEKLCDYPELLKIWKVLLGILFFLYVLNQHSSFFGHTYSNYLLLFTTLCFSVVFFIIMHRSLYFCSLNVCESTKVSDYKKFFISNLKTFLKGLIISIVLVFSTFISFWYLGFLTTYFSSEELYAIGLAHNFVGGTYVFFLCAFFFYTEGLKIIQAAHEIKDVYVGFPKAKRDILIVCISLYTILLRSPKLVVCLGFLCFVFNHIFLLCLVVYGLVLTCFWVNLPAQREKLLNKYNDQIFKILSFNHWSTPIVLYGNVLTTLVVLFTKVLCVGCLFTMVCGKLVFYPVLCSELEDLNSLEEVKKPVQTPLKAEKVLCEDPHRHIDEHDMFAETFVPRAKAVYTKYVKTLDNVLDTTIKGSFVACAAAETLAVSGTLLGPVIKGVSNACLGLGGICLGAKGALTAGNFAIEKAEDGFTFAASKALSISREGATELGEIAVKKTVASTSRTFDLFYKSLNNTLIKDAPPVQEGKAILAQCVTDFPVVLPEGSNIMIEASDDSKTTATNLVSPKSDFSHQTHELVKDQVVHTFYVPDFSNKALENSNVEVEKTHVKLSLKSKSPSLSTSSISQEEDDDDKSLGYSKAHDFGSKNLRIKNK